MPSYGANFGPIDTGKLAPGTSHDAGTRRHRNVFDLATNGGGGTTDSLLVAKVREGNCVEAASLSCSVSLAAINFSVGIAGNPTKYATAVAGPAANTTLRFNILTAALAADALAVPEDILFTPSAALPAAGTIVASVFTSKR